MEGIGEDFVPPIADLSRVRKAYRIPDRESLETARGAAAPGGDPGRLLLRHAAGGRPPLVPWSRNRPRRVCTPGLRLGQQVSLQDVRRPLDARPGAVAPGPGGRPHRPGHTAASPIARWSRPAPADTLVQALNRMKAADVSQLPVMEGERIVGIVDESDLLLAALGGAGQLGRPVGEVMARRLETVAPSTALTELTPALRRWAGSDRHGRRPLRRAGDADGRARPPAPAGPVTRRRASRPARSPRLEAHLVKPGYSGRAEARSVIGVRVH